MTEDQSKSSPKTCYNCGKELIEDFIPMVVSKEDENVQFLNDDFEFSERLHADKWREFDFEICANCGVAI